MPWASEASHAGGKAREIVLRPRLADGELLKAEAEGLTLNFEQ